MNTEAMKKFYEEVRYLTCMYWDEFQRLAKFNPTDDYFECENKLNNILCYLPNDDTRAWRYFQMVYEDIPVQHRLPLFFECVYRSFSVDYPSVLVMIADYLNHYETPEMKAERINKNHKYFSRDMTQDGKIVLYRCILERHLLPRSAIEFTTNRADAEHDYDEGTEEFGVVCEHEVNVEDILYCNHTFGDTVFIVPEDIKSGVYGYSGDLGILNIYTLEEDFPEEYEWLKESYTDEAFDDLFHLIDPSYIEPDRSLLETPIEALEAKIKGDFDLYHQLCHEHFQQRSEEYRKKQENEKARYRKARQAK